MNLPIGNRFWLYTLCVVLATMSAAGCGGLDSAELPAQKLVNELGGNMQVEGGHIVSIDLSSTEVQDSHLTTLQSLPELKKLSLNYCKGITDAVFAAAKEMKSLKELEAADTSITQRAADKFRDEHPEMVVSGPGI